jgi:Sec-independent protein translocase protein TatA
MENVYSLCFYGGLALAIIFLVASVVLFIVLKIPKVVGDLTGRNAKKRIEEMKNKKTTSSEISRKEQAKYYNQNSGKIKVRESTSPETRRANRDNTTDLLDENERKPKWNEHSGKSDELKKTGYDPDATDVLGSSTANARDYEATDVLRDNEGDTYAGDNETTDVLRDNEATDVLRDEDATDVLMADDATSNGSDDVTDVLRAEETVGSDDVTDVLRAEGTVGSDDVTDVLRAEGTVGNDDVTDVLRAEGPVESDDVTDVLRADGWEKDDEEATDVLKSDSSYSGRLHNSTVIYNVVITHTEETI